MKIVTKKQLLEQISLLVDEYINHALLNKKPDYDLVLENQEQEGLETQSSRAESQDVSESVDDNLCLAFLTNGKRCTRERHPEGPDQEVCKFHNNKKFNGRLEKLTKDGPSEKKMKRHKKKTQPSSTKEEEEEEVVDVQEVCVAEDEEGHMVDQNGAIWDVENEIIIGKKDLMTKQKIFYKKL